MLGTDSGVVQRFVGFMVSTVKIVSFVVGVGALLFADIFLGASYYAMALGGSRGAERVTDVQMPFADSALSAGAIGLGLSFATTALQIVFWTMLINGGSIKDMIKSPAAIVGGLGFLVIMVADTMADLAAATHLMFPSTPRLDVLPQQSLTDNFGAAAVLVVIMVMCVVNEPMLKMIVDRNKTTPSARAAY